MPAKSADAPSTSSQGTARPPVLPRSAVPYYVAAVFALATMAWYVFMFVPSKVEYFVGLKLRALAVAASQIETRAENLTSALTTAPFVRGKDGLLTGATATYLRALVPDIRILKPDDPRPAGLRLRFPDGAFTAQMTVASGPTGPAGDSPADPKPAPPVEVTAGVGWEQLTAQAATVSAAEFDDLIVALPNGDVVWQREATTPRIGNLAQVLEGKAVDGGWFSFSWSPAPEVPNKDAKGLPTAVTVKAIELGGAASLLLVQTIALQADAIEIESPQSRPEAVKGAAPEAAPREHRLHVAGIVPLATLRAQAMTIPVAWVVALALPVIVLFLALPAVKLATLTSHERFSLVDAVMFLIATIAIAALGATLALTQTVVDESGDQMLARFSGSLQSRIVEEVKKVQALAATLKTGADALESALEDCAVPIALFPRKRCNFWLAFDSSQNKPANVSTGEIELDIVAWLNPLGQQIDKWTAKAQLTGPTSHDRFQHYRDLMLDRLWTLPGDNQRFTIEPLRSPTTAELAVIVAFRLADGQKSDGRAVESAANAKAPGTTGAPQSVRDTASFLAINIRPRSLLDVVTPPGFGFAVITQDGRVLFHSQENLSLAENFFEEVGESEWVRARAQSGRVVTWTGDYHGRPHRIHIERPVALRGCPWRIVTFRDLTPVYGGAFAHQSGTFRLALINLSLLAVFAFCVRLHAAWKHRDVRDLLNVHLITEWRWIWWQAGLAALAIGVVVFTYHDSAGRVLNVIYALFVLLPFAALWIAVRARRHEHSAPRVQHQVADRRGLPRRPDAAGNADAARKAGDPPPHPWLVWAELIALVILVAALPACGFARLAERVQVSRASERLLEELQRSVTARNIRVLSRLNGPGYTFPQPASTQAVPSRDVRELLKKDPGFARVETVGSYTYLDFVPIEIATPAAPGPSKPAQGQGLVRFLLDWDPLPSTDLAGEPAMVVEQGRFKLNSPSTDLPALAVRDSSIGLPPFLAGATPFSVPLLKGVLGGILLVGAAVGLCWARQRLLAHIWRDAPSLKQVLACLPREGKHGVMVIGAPSTKKDTVLVRVLRRRNTRVELRIRLLESDGQPDLVDSQLHTLAKAVRRRWWQSCPGPTVRPDGNAWINVSNLETHLVHQDRRKLALELLERLLDRGPNDMSRVVVVTTNIDPVAHFEEIFEEERRGIYKDAVPEVDLSRFAVLLTRFHRCYVPFRVGGPTDDPWWDYDKTTWREVLKWETCSVALRGVRRELRRRWNRRERVSIDELSRAIGTRAAAVYQLLWTSCTRREKLVLVQLAQEGFVTPQSDDVVAALLAKGLIVMRPGPAIFNYTFRSFLREIERSDIVRKWEGVEGNGLWVVAGRLIGSSVLAGGLFFLLTQGYSVDGLLPVLSGTGLLGVPIVRNLVARLTTKGSPPSA